VSKVINRERLRAKLRSLPDNIKDGIKAPLEKGAQGIADLAIHLCPERKGALRNSIDWNYGDPPLGVKIGGVGNKTNGADPSDLIISIYAGNDRAFYARWVEFGTRASTKGDKVTGKKGRTRTAGRTHPGTPAHPFFFPAYRAMRNPVVNAIGSATRSALKKSANMGS
jgi:HK97 gp10 family phage protein